jgi:hypothetical protein
MQQNRLLDLVSSSEEFLPMQPDTKSIINKRWRYHTQPEIHIWRHYQITR